MVWKRQNYSVPEPGRRGFRWKASALRTLRHWSPRFRKPQPALIVVPALFNRLPAETFAMGWLNEIDALHSIRQRIGAVAKKTGWDVLTFHTQHNLDPYYDSTIAAVRETWSREGRLSSSDVAETKRRFGNVYSYHRFEPRLIENAVFQTSLMECVTSRAEDTPIQFHVIGTALYSALIHAGSLSFNAALDSILKVGARWDKAMESIAGEESRRFEVVRSIIEGAERVSLAVAREDLPRVDSPCKPFWFSPSGDEEPVRVETARDAASALESLNLTSWWTGNLLMPEHLVRGFLNSPHHPLARRCRHSLSSYLLATPSLVAMFMQYIAGIGRTPVMSVEPESQDRLRLSRMKVTGP